MSNKNEEISSISFRVLELRKAKNLTQQAFSDLLGVSRVSISDLENGKVKKPSVDIIVGISSNMPDVDVTWVLTGEGSMYKSSDSEPAELHRRRLLEMYDSLTTEQQKEILSIVHDKKQVDDLTRKVDHLYQMLESQRLATN